MDLKKIKMGVGGSKIKNDKKEKSNLIKPKKLKIGDTIGIIAPCGKVDNREYIDRAVKFFSGKGFNVKISDHILDKKRYLAGEDNIRLKELHNFFKDPKIDAIICLRGGYGAIRLIKNIDYEIIKKNPKIFCGFSDVSALLLMILKKTGLVTYHGPMIQSDFGQESLDDFTINNFFNVFQSDHLEYEGSKIYKSGICEGILWGGNLSTVITLCGQDFLPDEDFIFFTEDLNESCYKIDRMFTQLLNIDKFRNHLKGLIIGTFSGNDNEEFLEELIKEIAENLNIPVAGGFKISHEKQKITLPIGVNAKLDGLKLIIYN